MFLFGESQKLESLIHLTSSPKYRTIMVKISIPSVFLLCGLVVLFSGCPDYSHLRPEPDYQNMVDGGAEDSTEDAVK